MSRSAPSGAGATATRRREPTVSTTAAWAASRRGRAPVDEVARVLELFDTRYWDFTAKHFHEKLVADHGFQAQLQLAAAELASPWAQARGAPGVGRTGASGRAVPCPA